MSRKSFRDLIVYEIYPTSFKDTNHDGIGDLRGITQKLDYIKESGFNALWLNPFYKSPFKDGGYDVEDFFAVDPRFGTMDDYRELISEAHKRDIKVFIDLVAGHASFMNKDFLKSAEPQRNEKSDLFIWNDNPWQPDGQFRFISGMYQRHGCYMVNFFAHQPAFNYGFKVIEHPEWQMSYKDERTFAARNYMLNVMRFWLKEGTDGFRVDMADSLVKKDDDKKATAEVWRWMFERIRKEYPEAFFVSEWSNPKQSFDAGFDADFVLDHWDNFYHRFFRSNESSRGDALITGRGDMEYAIKDMKERFTEAEKTDSYLALISGNHDTWRIANYLDDKDLRVFYMMLFTLPGVPFVLYGDEIGMKTSDIPSKDGGFQRTGTRIPMIWNNEKPNHGFCDSECIPYLPFNEDNKMSVNDEIKNGNSLYNYIRKLAQLRNEISDLKDPHLDIRNEKRVLTFTRGKYELIVNMSDRAYAFKGKRILSSAEFTGKLPVHCAVLVYNNVEKEI